MKKLLILISLVLSNMAVFASDIAKSPSLDSKKYVNCELQSFQATLVLNAAHQRKVSVSQILPEFIKTNPIDQTTQDLAQMGENIQNAKELTYENIYDSGIISSILTGMCYSK